MIAEVANLALTAYALANPEPRRSASRDALQSLAIGVAIVVPLALYLRRRTSPAPAASTEGLPLAPGLRRMRY